MIPEFRVRFVNSVGIVHLDGILRSESRYCESHSHAVVFVARHSSA